MTTLAEATLNLGRNLKDYHQGTATSTGTTTTLIDSALDAQDGFFDGGTIWFLTGTLAGKSAVVSSWNLADRTLTFETQTAAAASTRQTITFQRDNPISKPLASSHRQYRTCWSTVKNDRARYARPAQLKMIRPEITCARLPGA